MPRKQPQPRLENAKIYSTSFRTMLQAVPRDAIILQEIPAYFYAIDFGNCYRMYRYFFNKQAPERILEVGIIPKIPNYKEGDIYVY